MIRWGGEGVKCCNQVLGAKKRDKEIDFSHEPGEASNIQTGSFYVALTRVKQGKDVYLRSFDEKFITYNKLVKEN